VFTRNKLNRLDTAAPLFRDSQNQFWCIALTLYFLFVSYKDRSNMVPILYRERSNGLCPSAHVFFHPSILWCSGRQQSSIRNLDLNYETTNQWDWNLNFNQVTQSLSKHVKFFSHIRTKFAFSFFWKCNNEALILSCDNLTLGKPYEINCDEGVECMLCCQAKNKKRLCHYDLCFKVLLRSYSWFTEVMLGDYNVVIGNYC
jgi:hypothetical protein